jgi:hypothetical protein
VSTTKKSEMKNRIGFFFKPVFEQDLLD